MQHYIKYSHLMRIFSVKEKIEAYLYVFCDCESREFTTISNPTHEFLLTNSKKSMYILQHNPTYLI